MKEQEKYSEEIVNEMEANKIPDAKLKYWL